MVLSHLKHIQGGASLNVDHFQNYVTGELSSTSAILRALMIPPHLKHVATLPSEILLPALEYLHLQGF